MTPEAIVQKQLDAYNNRDIQNFVACHAENVTLYSFSQSTPYVKGRNQLSVMYSAIFEESPELHSKLLNRIVLDNTVIDYEEIIGRKGVDLLELVAIYEIKDGLIAKAHFIRK